MPAFSVNMMPNIPAKEIANLANYAERKGCKRCWVYDEGLTTRDVYVTLAAIAAKTKKIHLGPGITNAYVRHPAATASAIATLDELSDGRAFIGIGAGGGLTLDPLAISRTNPLTTVQEMVESLRSLFQGNKTTFEGKNFSLANAYLSYGRKNIEIILAGRGPKMLQLGADIADGFYLSYIYKDHLARVMSVLRNGRASEERNFNVTYSTMLATNEKELKEARGQLSFRLVDSPMEIKEELGMTIGDVQQIKQALSEGGASLAGEYVKEEWVDKFVIVGDSQSCKEELLELLEIHTIDEFQLPIYEPSTAESLIDQVSTFF
ncbi:MAG: hypothetical protein CL455_02505 [Acidimicrobiaceae bacterium]|nr:hypothetical protein [Acidimicrobiaceae bacterium]